MIILIFKPMLPHEESFESSQTSLSACEQQILDVCNMCACKSKEGVWIEMMEWRYFYLQTSLCMRDANDLRSWGIAKLKKDDPSDETSIKKQERQSYEVPASHIEKPNEELQNLYIFTGGKRWGEFKISSNGHTKLYHLDINFIASCSSLSRHQFHSIMFLIIPKISKHPQPPRIRGVIYNLATA